MHTNEYYNLLIGNKTAKQLSGPDYLSITHRTNNTIVIVGVDVNKNKSCNPCTIGKGMCYPLVSASFLQAIDELPSPEIYYPTEYLTEDEKVKERDALPVIMREIDNEKRYSSANSKLISFMYGKYYKPCYLGEQKCPTKQTKWNATDITSSMNERLYEGNISHVFRSLLNRTPIKNTPAELYIKQSIMNCFSEEFVKTFLPLTNDHPYASTSILYTQMNELESSEQLLVLNGLQTYYSTIYLPVISKDIPDKSAFLRRITPSFLEHIRQFCIDVYFILQMVKKRNGVSIGFFPVLNAECLTKCFQSISPFNQEYVEHSDFYSTRPTSRSRSSQGCILLEGGGYTLFKQMNAESTVNERVPERIPERINESVLERTSERVPERVNTKDVRNMLLVTFLILIVLLLIVLFQL